MPGNISKRRLLVVSDTPAAVCSDGVDVYEPVLREMNRLLNLFDEIIWLTSNAGMGKYALLRNNNTKLKIVVMPSVYNTRFNWLFSISHYPAFLFYISKYLREVEYVHTRGPSHPALVTILKSLTDSKRQYWHKYAGNWSGNDLPYMYRFQKWLLKRNNNSVVTINGTEPQSRNILHFENPCFTEEELNTAIRVGALKQFDADLSLLFVGNLYKAKGVLNLLEALNQKDWPAAIKRCFIVGNGPLYDEVKQLAQNIKHVEVIVTGALSREQLNKYYVQCHLLILPSQSEGFPKVIAEAASYGCIPVVTGVSVIPHYIESGVNGYLLPENGSSSICKTLQALLKHDLKLVSRNAMSMAPAFTYEHYITRIKNEVYDFKDS